MKYPLQFKAAICEKSNAPLSITEVTFSGPLKEGQVLVEVHYSGICGKQIEEIGAVMGPDPYLPHLLGHEGTGIVKDIGSGVKTVAIGDKVIMHWLKGNGIDAALPEYTYKEGTHLNAGQLTTFNEYAVVAENRLTPIKEEFDMIGGCLLGCAATTGLGLVINDAQMKAEESIAVVGCGGVGLNAIQGARVQKGKIIIAIDVNEESLLLAKQFGATHTINAEEEDIIQAVKKIIPEGVNHVALCVSNQKAIETGISISSIPGTVYFAAVPATGTKITIDALDIHRMRTLRGSTGGGSEPERDIPKYLHYSQEGKVDLQSLISLVVPLDEINKGIEQMRTGKIARCVVRML